MKKISIMIMCLLFTGSFLCAAQNKEDDMTVQQGKEVTVEYTLTVDEEVVDSSEQGQPLKYTHGEGKLLSGLSQGLEGMKEGEQKEITIQPEEAYGQVNPQAVREIPRSNLPQGVEPKVGMVLQAQSPDGRTIPVMIKEVKEDTLVIDFNHPLAGKELHFDVKVTEVN